MPGLVTAPNTDYACIQLTLTDPTKNYSLYALLVAVDPHILSIARGLTIQNGTVAGPNSVFIGDSGITLAGTPRYGFYLGPGESRTYGPGESARIPLNLMFVQADTASTFLNVEVML